MKSTKPRDKKVEPFLTTCIKMTASEQKDLQALAQSLTDLLGRSVSKGATLRAVVRFAARQKHPWCYENILPELEAELSVHSWGLKPAKSAHN